MLIFQIQKLIIKRPEAVFKEASRIAQNNIRLLPFQSPDLKQANTEMTVLKVKIVLLIPSFQLRLLCSYFC